MAFLLVIVYIAFISLGVPDSLIGAAWPAIYPDMQMPVEAISGITLLISGSTVLSGFISTGLLNKFGTAKVTAFSTAMTAVALIGFSFAPNYWVMLPCAVVLGLGAGAIDAGLNNFVALHFSAKHMNFLHCFYGIGVSLSPYLMSLALSSSGWRWGYRYAFFIQGAITLMLIFSLPLWKKAIASNSEEEECEAEKCSFFQMLKMPTVRLAWLVILITNALEYTCGTWASTYLVSEKHLAAEVGAIGLTVYYIGMAMGRFLSGLISSRVKTWNRIWIGCGIVAVAVVMFILPLPVAVSITALFLIGLGNGSIYPNLMHLTPYNFGKSLSQAIMGSQIAFAYIGVMIAPPLVSVICNVLGMGIYPVFIIVLAVAMIISMLAFALSLKKQSKYFLDV